MAALTLTAVSCYLDPITIAVTGITITPAGTVSVLVGRTTTLTATVTPPDATNKNITWGTLTPTIATVNASTGVVTGVSAGTATIRAVAVDGSLVLADKTVTVTELPPVAHGISLSPAALNFGSPLVGYTQPAAQTITITNTGTSSVTLSQPEATNYNITAPLPVTIASGGTATFTVRPHIGLAAGTYNRTISVSGTNGANATFTVSFTVRAMAGDGSASNPYIIMTAANLNNVRNNMLAHYELGADIDLASYLSGGAGFSQWGAAGWLPIGTMSNRFTGALDGAGYKITGLTINRPTTNDVGLFGFIGSGATVKNLGVEITLGAAGGIKGQNFVGGVAGWVDGGSSISNCYVTGNVSGSNFIGGVVGATYGSISNCYATGAVGGTRAIGGVVGQMVGGIIFNCVAFNPSVTATGGSDLGRVTGSTLAGSTSANNFARNDMTITGKTTLVKGGDTLDGADCATVPTPEWWTTAAPNGPNWNANYWHFVAGHYPTLKLQ